MADRVDLIKGLIMQNEIKSRSKRGDKKQASKLLVQIKKIFNDVLKEDDDNVFEGDIIRLLSSPRLIHIFRVIFFHRICRSMEDIEILSNTQVIYD